MENNFFLTKFTTRLKELRKELSLSQSELAKKLNVPASTYANWEQGRREPSIYDIYNIILCLNITANDLFDID